MQCLIQQHSGQRTSQRVGNACACTGTSTCPQPCTFMHVANVVSICTVCCEARVDTSVREHPFNHGTQTSLKQCSEGNESLMMVGFQN